MAERIGFLGFVLLLFSNNVYVIRTYKMCVEYWNECCAIDIFISQGLKARSEFLSPQPSKH